MQRRSTGVLALTTLVLGCFSPDPAATSDDTAGSTSQALDDESGPGLESTGAGPGPGDGTTTGVGDSTGDPPDPSETGEPGDGSTTGDEMGSTDEGSSTGEACELGTNTDCLACGDACSPEGECSPGEGCLEPLVLGHDQPFGDLGGLDGFLWGFPVELTTPATLTHLAFIANGVGGNVQLSLYEDAGGSPSTRLVTAPPVEGYAPGVNEIEVPSQDLAAGTYWIMATATNPTRIGMDLNGGAVNFAVQGIIHDYAAGHPDLIVDPVPFVNYRPNFYARFVQVQPGA